MDENKQSKGGKARAESLSPEERSNIARKAADARWNFDIPKALSEGTFNIGEIPVKASVLPNGKRLINQATFLTVIGRSRSPKAGTGVLSTVDGLPFFLQADRLKSFLNEELIMSTTPIFYFDQNGGRQVGYDAELLPRVAEVYLKLRDECLQAGKPIPRHYDHIIKACDVVVRGLAHVGIIALIDEATGYQDERAKNALADILEQFVQEELRKWIRTFPLAYYQELCRLKNVPFSTNMKLPQYFGHITNDIVYTRLAPGVLESLQAKNPSQDGQRRHKNFQYLTDDVGHPKLLMLLGSIVSLMKLSKTWDEFYKLLDRVHPSYRDMPLFAGIQEDQ